jgi:hypothetical protein
VLFISNYCFYSIIISLFLNRYPKGFVGLTTMGSMMSYNNLKCAFKKAFKKSNIVELMVHPGYPNINNNGGCGCGPDDFSKSEDRLHELNVLSNQDILSFYQEKNIKLINFNNLKFFV